MNLKYSIAAIATVLAFNVSYGQQRFQTSLYHLNPYSVNTAVAGLDSCSQVNIQHKNQWTSVSGSPTSTLLNGYTSIAKNLSVGIELSRWSAGVLSATELSASIAKGFKINNLNLAASVTLGAAQHTFGLNQVTVFDVDNYLNQTAQNAWGTFADIAAIARYNNLEIGLALPRFIASNSTFTVNSSDLVFNPANYLRFNAAYTVQVSNELRLKPYALYRSIPGNGGALDVVVHGVYNQKIGAALGYRTQSGLLASLNYNINTNWQIGYAYDAGMQALTGVSAGSHELLLTWRSCKVKQPKAPKEPVLQEVVLGTIKGSVSNGKNKPLINQSIELFSGDSLVEKTTTDSLGNYSFDVKPNASYVVKVASDSYNSFSSQPIELLETSLTQKQNIQLTTPTANFEVIVFNAVNNQVLPNAQVTITLNGATVANKTSNAKGEVTFTVNELQLNEPLNFKTVVEKEGFKTKSENFTASLESYESSQLNVLNPSAFKLVETPKEQNAVELLQLNPITYEIGSSKLTTESLNELNKIIEFLNTHESTSLEISAHTDCTGSAEGNLNLSKKRANTVKAYIQERVENPSRVSANGYGETQPIESCECKDCSQAQHALNRRTEFVLKN